ncbi:uncharacterized protein LOC143259148 [Megalopta genalis]|uniref:uncharacterized protein LOC143259148 n=1 Tax=Megalopta genalis TaxID=115081 RepID=UPI003FD5BCA5
MENTDTTSEETIHLKNEESSIFLYDKALRTPIRKSFLKAFDIPNESVDPVILDTSLPYIPIYTHLKTYNLKPIERPKTPPMLSMLRSKALDRNDDELYSPSEIPPSTEQVSRKGSFSTLMSKEHGKTSKME